MLTRKLQLIRLAKLSRKQISLEKHNKTPSKRSLPNYDSCETLARNLLSAAVLYTSTCTLQAQYGGTVFYFSALFPQSNI
jgi:hypothetical protein